MRRDEAAIRHFDIGEKTLVTSDQPALDQRTGESHRQDLLTGMARETATTPCAYQLPSTQAREPAMVSSASSR